MAQGLYNSLLLLLQHLHTSLSKEKGRAASTLNTKRHSGKPDSVALHNTFPTPEVVHWSSRDQPVRQASALVREGGTCHLAKKERKKEKERKKKKELN